MITTSDHIIWTATIPAGASAHCYFSATAGKESAKSERFYLSPAFWINPTSETLAGGGTVTLVTAVPSSSVTCDASGIGVQGSGNEWTAALPNKTATYTFTATLDKYVASCTVSVEYAPASSDDDDDTHTHSYTIATCVSPALCSCGKTNGEKNPNNHTGGTEIRNAADATIVANGYAGDTYCKGCGAKLESGEVIPKKTQISEDAGVEDVTFTPGEGLVLPEDAVLVVEPHKPSVEDLNFLLLTEKTEPSIRTTVVPEDLINIWNPTVIGPNGEVSTGNQLLVIDGAEYYVQISIDGTLHLYDKEGNLYEYDGEGLPIKIGSTDMEFPENEYVSINGAIYQVHSILRDTDGNGTLVLYLDGKPAGMCQLGKSEEMNSINIYNEDNAPDKVKERRQQRGYVGAITPGENPIDGLKSGKTHDVLVIGAQDISVSGYNEALLNSIQAETEEEKAAREEVERLKADMEAKKAAVERVSSGDANKFYATAEFLEAEKAYKETLAKLAVLTNLQSGTVTQKFQIPGDLVGRTDVTFVAVHKTANGNEIGEITLSED